MPLLFDFQHITITRGQRNVLQDFSLQIGLGAHVALLGPNGSGKSTLIKAVTRELYPVQGNSQSTFKIFGQGLWDIFELRRRLGIVSPDMLFQVTRDITARELVLSGFFSSLGLWPHHAVTPAMERKANSVLRFLDIAHLADRPIAVMSSGENRRALIGRALVHNPKALILDEPTNSLDPKAMREFRAVMRKVAQAGTTLVLVTHQLHDIIPEIKRVILLKKGKIFCDGPKTSVLTAKLLSDLFDFPARVVSRQGYFDLI